MIADVLVWVCVGIIVAILLGGTLKFYKDSNGK